MSFRDLDLVVLTKDVGDSEVNVGDVGVVVMVYDEDNFEIEFVRDNGSTQALLTLNAACLRSAVESDLNADGGVDNWEPRKQ